MQEYQGNRDVFAKYADAEVFDRIVSDGDLCRMWLRSVRENAEQTAVVFDGKETTYGQLDREVAGLRSALAEAGCVPGNRVAVLCANSLDFVRAFFAVVTAGCCAAVLPPQLPPEAVFGCCMLFGVKGLVCHAPTKDKTELLASRMPSIPFVDAASRCLKEVPVAEVRADYPCTIMFTGGTTGNNNCGAGKYYLLEGSSCVSCENNYFCPGNGQHYKCPFNGRSTNLEGRSCSFTVSKAQLSTCWRYATNPPEYRDCMYGNLPSLESLAH